MPPPKLKYFALDGYKSASYPRWLLVGSYFEKLNHFVLRNCSALQGLPPREIFGHCSVLVINNVPNLKTLPCLPTGLELFEIKKCPVLMFICSNDLEQNVEKEHMMKTDHLASQLALIWQSSSESYPTNGLLAEHSSLKQLMPLMDTDISEHLRSLESAADGKGGDELVKEHISRAWVYCHEQRIKLLYNKSSIGVQLVLPPALRYVSLWSCNITDGALATGLGGLTSLETLELKHIMTLTTLPSQRDLPTFDSTGTFGN